MSPPVSGTQTLGVKRRAPSRANAPDRAMRTDVGTPLAFAFLLCGCLIVAWEARHSTFTADDWSFILQRRGLSAAVLLQPHNEHLSALPILAYKVLLAVFGLGSYAPFIALLLILHAIVCLTLYVLARRYIGPWAALAPAAIVAVLGPAWQDLLWAFQIGYLGSTAAGLCMVWCLERRDRKGDVWAGILLGASLLCSSVGLAMVVFAAVLIVLQRPTVWRRMWAVAVPVALYLLWYSKYGVSTIRASNIHLIPSYVFHAASAAVASVTGLAETHVSPFLVATRFGSVVLILVVAFFVFHLVRGYRPPPLTWAALATALALWVAEALEYFPGGREAAQSRYQYVGGVLVLLAAVSAANGWRPRTYGFALAAATLLVCGSNIAMLHDRAGFWSTNSAYDRAETGALEVTRGIVSPSFAPENVFNIAIMGDHNLTLVTAGPYFSAVDEWGSSADRPQEILRSPEFVREAADLVVATGERLALFPAKLVHVNTSVCGSAQAQTNSGDALARPGDLVIARFGSLAGQFELRRFGSLFRYLHWRIPARVFVATRLPVDRSTVPWHVGMLGGAGARLCVFGPADR